jgi:hypothetical protein
MHHVRICQKLLVNSNQAHRERLLISMQNRLPNRHQWRRAWHRALPRSGQRLMVQPHQSTAINHTLLPVTPLRRQNLQHLLRHSQWLLLLSNAQRRRACLPSALMLWRQS